MCGGAGEQYVSGTVSPQSYFGGHAYRIADSADLRLDVSRCVCCGHGWSPVATGSVLQWYEQAPADRSYLAEEQGRRRAAARVLRLLARHAPPPGTLLDVGASTGLLLTEARAMGWTVQGLEPARWAVDESRNRGLGDSVRLGDTETLPSLPAGGIDALTAVDVLEHLPNPEDFLRQCARIVRPGGAVAIVTPRFDSVFARLCGKRWYAIMPAHLHYFTQRSLLKIITDAGLEPVAVRHHVRSFGIGYLLSRLLKRDPACAPSRWIVPVPLFDTLEVIARVR